MIIIMVLVIIILCRVPLPLPPCPDAPRSPTKDAVTNSQLQASLQVNFAMVSLPEWQSSLKDQPSYRKCLYSNGDPSIIKKWFNCNTGNHLVTQTSASGDVSDCVGASCGTP